MTRSFDPKQAELSPPLTGLEGKLDTTVFSVGTGGLTQSQIDEFLPELDQRGTLIAGGFLLVFLVSLLWLLAEGPSIVSSADQFGQ